MYDIYLISSNTKLLYKSFSLNAIIMNTGDYKYKCIINRHEFDKYKNTLKFYMT